MRIAVLGTGEVGRRLGGRLAELGHQVTLGSRTADNSNPLDFSEGFPPKLVVPEEGSVAE